MRVLSFLVFSASRVSNVPACDDETTLDSLWPLGMIYILDLFCVLTARAETSMNHVEAHLHKDSFYKMVCRTNILGCLGQTKPILLSRSLTHRRSSHTNKYPQRGILIMKTPAKKEKTTDAFPKSLKLQVRPPILPNP